MCRPRCQREDPLFNTKFSGAGTTPPGLEGVTNGVLGLPETVFFLITSGDKKLVLSTWNGSGGLPLQKCSMSL